MSADRYWAADVNEGELEVFTQEIAKADSSSGDFRADYFEVSRKLGVVPCSLVSFDASLNACKVTNCAIDLPAWRAALIACGLQGSPVTSVVVHHCLVTQQHISDLLIMLDKRVEMVAIKIDNCEWGPDPTAANSILTSLISTKAAVQYMSFRYNGLNDSFITASALALSQNLFLRHLNLSNNNFSDEGLLSLVTGALRCNLSIKKIALKNNLIEGSSLVAFVDLLFGSVCTSEEDVSFKAIAKAATDKNKQIKDLNKKRKKNNELDMLEIEIPERVVKSGKTDLVLLNKTIKEIDLSWNKITRENVEAFRALATERKEQSSDIDVRAVSRAEGGITAETLSNGFAVIY